MTSLTTDNPHPSEELERLREILVQTRRRLATLRSTGAELWRIELREQQERDLLAAIERVGGE